MNKPIIDAVDFDKTSMIVRVDVLGHPTDALELARSVFTAILSARGAWCITRIDGMMTDEAQYPSDFRMRVQGERMG